MPLTLRISQHVTLNICSPESNEMPQGNALHSSPWVCKTKHSCIEILWWFLGCAYAEVSEGQYFGRQEGFEQ